LFAGAPLPDQSVRRPSPAPSATATPRPRHPATRWVRAPGTRRQLIPAPGNPLG